MCAGASPATIAQNRQLAVAAVSVAPPAVTPAGGSARGPARSGSGGAGRKRGGAVVGARALEAPGLDRDDAAVGLALRFHLAEHLRLRVDGVAVERRLLVLQGLDLEIRDRDTTDVGNRHPEHERVHQVADHDVFAELGLALCVIRVGVERVMVHRHHAEQMVVELGDRLAGPVFVDVAGLEILEVAAERALVHGHGREATQAPCPRPERAARARSRGVESHWCPRR